MVNYLVHALSGFVSNVLAKELPFNYLRSKSKVFEHFFSPVSPVWFPRECYRRSLSSQGSFKRKFSDGRDIYRNNSSMVFLMVAIIPTTVETGFKVIAAYGANLKWCQGLRPLPLLSEISGVFGMLSVIV